MDQLISIPNVEFEVLTHPFGGEHYIVRFSNGYGASIVRNEMSYGGSSGLYEVAVIHNDMSNKWPLCYATPITNDVIGWLTVDGIIGICRDIGNLPPNDYCNHSGPDLFDNLESEDDDAGYLH